MCYPERFLGIDGKHLKVLDIKMMKLSIIIISWKWKPIDILAICLSHKNMKKARLF